MPERGTTRENRGGRIVSWVGLVGIVLFAVALSVQSYREGLPSMMQSVPQLDKVIHFTIGGTMAFFLDIILRRRMVRIGSRVAIPLAAILLLVPTGIEEYMQRYSTNRSSSIWDFAADAAGVFFFIWLSRRLVRNQDQNRDQNQKPA